MHNSFIVGFSLALIWLVLRYIFGMYLEPEIAFKAGVFINIFFVLISIFIVFLFSKKKSGYEASTTMSDFKLCIKGGIVYVVFVSLAIFVFYKYIDTSLFDYKTEAVEKQLSKLSKEEIIKRKNTQESTKSLTSEEFIKQVKERSKAMANAKTQAIFSGLGLSIWCLLASLICTIIFRKVLFAHLK